MENATPLSVFDSSRSPLEVSCTLSYGTLPTPTKTGYSFAGWYKNSDLSGSPVSTSDIVTANHTLYAKWQEMHIYVTGSSTSVSSFVYEYINTRNSILYITPQTGHYISQISFDNSTFFDIEFSIGSYDNLPVALGVQYFANTNSNELEIDFKGLLKSYLNNNGGIHIYIKTTTTPYTELKSSNGANIEGISVTSTKGGTAYIVGDDFDNLTDTDTITFATKPCLSGYDFSHWQDLDGNNLGTEMSIRLQKSQVMDNIITAVYVQSSSNVNDNLNN
ncbi:MAG: InlB B-repeat-containing protein [Clostridia bacterium]|nr:InlB B-repeat-containing protein [Clostridia bacterium]